MQAKIATTSVDDDFTGNEWEFQLSIISANQARATHSIESDTEIKTRLLQLSVFPDARQVNVLKCNHVCPESNDVC
jgi:hypothetical protein